MKNNSATEIGVGKARLLRDRRFLAGVFLVVISALLGAWLFQSISAGTSAYIAAKPLAAGATVSESDIRIVDIRVPGDPIYASAPDSPVGKTLTRSVGAGELIPVASLSSTPQDYSRIVVSPKQPLPAQTQVGDLVQVWAVVKARGGVDQEQEQSSLLSAEAVVMDIRQGKTSIGVNAGNEVEIAVPKGSLGSVIDAIGADKQLILVPTHRK
ncbi:SAF domain-containing protein [Boudabousia marimammalium]|uniref:SAF domain-containing protein n=1 Tax=Boudabousia marimammalium TaxID=156892 RepID=A0A1Q5PRX8_9ACTO|nr:SAF domain-containing protein [Boudabousia marimammalium]OKL50192.1 hypothetical protein BM477_02015 [Boudabousia marimammalium]